VKNATSASNVTTKTDTISVNLVFYFIATPQSPENSGFAEEGEIQPLYDTFYFQTLSHHAPCLLR